MSHLVKPDVMQRMVNIRRDLHRYPELGWQEEGTATRICQELDRLQIPYQKGIAKTGIVAEIPGPSHGPIIGLRADMDALPIQEETNLPFQSLVPGRMHACGHDGHVSILLGAAQLLMQEKQLPATVRLIFQPAEELGTGAKAMVEAGAIQGVDAIFGGHLDRHYATGTVVVGEGVVNASTDSFLIEIRGKGGHAARPHEAVDAVVVGSLLIMALQTIVSREVNPAHPSVVTVGRFTAGTAHNVIADQALLEGTVRAQDAEVRSHLKISIGRIAQSIATLHGAAVEVRFTDGTPALRSSREMLPLAQQAATSVVGEDRVFSMPTANMGGEDFAYYLEEIPGCYVRFGAQIANRQSYPAHSSRFDFDEQAMATAAAYYLALVKIAGRQLSATRCS